MSFQLSAVVSIPRQLSVVEAVKQHTIVCIVCHRTISAKSAVVPSFDDMSLVLRGKKFDKNFPLTRSEILSKAKCPGHYHAGRVFKLLFSLHKMEGLENENARKIQAERDKRRREEERAREARRQMSIVASKHPGFVNSTLPLIPAEDKPNPTYRVRSKEPNSGHRPRFKKGRKQKGEGGR